MDEEERKWERVWRAEPSNQEALRNAIAALYRAGKPVPAELRDALVPPAELVARVIAEPERDEPRFAYADWLLTLGEPRGEFIRTQCALSGRNVTWPDRVELRAREKRLLATYGSQWAPAVRALTPEFRFRRGFVEGVEVAARHFLGPRGAAALAAEPITDVVLDASSDSILELAVSPVLGRLRALTLRGLGMDHEIVALVRSPLASKIVGLNLGRCEVGPEVAQAIANSPSMASLKMLALSGCPIGDEGVAALADSPNLANCERLFLSRTEVTEVGVRALAASTHLKNLRRVSLNGNDLDEDASQVLESSPGLESLRSVELRV